MPKRDDRKRKYGVCRVCGCTDYDPCWHPKHGCCWWADDTHTLCSHCADPEIADSPETVHCIYSEPDERDIASQKAREELCSKCDKRETCDYDCEDFYDMCEEIYKEITED